MNKLTTAIVACVVSTGSLVPLAAKAAPADAAKIKALEARLAAAVAARDLDAVMKAYSPDVLVFDVSPPRQYVGAGAYREDWKGFFSFLVGPIKFEISDLVVSTEGTLGYSHSIQHVSGANSAGGKIDLTVRVTDVYRKQHGAWRIVHEHVSAPVDLVTAKADLTSRP